MHKFANNAGDHDDVPQTEETGESKSGGQELDLDALEEVSGGTSLRDLPKEKTTDIDDNTKSRI
ncbi:MAG: hypothetical protein K0R57_424 [Paenibacillaceae bacterium]|jgi:hypothetical protein|nr:hypothetical protein [Paenibacillaceae bacterium]